MVGVDLVFEGSIYHYFLWKEKQALDEEQSIQNLILKAHQQQSEKPSAASAPPAIAVCPPATRPVVIDEQYQILALTPLGPPATSEVVTDVIQDDEANVDTLVEVVDNNEEKVDTSIEALSYIEENVLGTEDGKDVHIDEKVAITSDGEEAFHNAIADVEETVPTSVTASVIEGTADESKEVDHDVTGEVTEPAVVTTTEAVKHVPMSLPVIVPADAPSSSLPSLNSISFSGKYRRIIDLIASEFPHVACMFPPTVASSPPELYRSFQTASVGGNKAWLSIQPSESSAGVQQRGNDKSYHGKSSKSKKEQRRSNRDEDDFRKYRDSMDSDHHDLVRDAAYDVDDDDSLSFTDYYRRLERYYTRYGHFRVTYKQDPKLEDWIRRIRKVYLESLVNPTKTLNHPKNHILTAEQLTQDRIELLTSIQFPFNHFIPTLPKKRKESSSSKRSYSTEKEKSRARKRAILAADSDNTDDDTDDDNNNNGGSNRRPKVHHLIRRQPYTGKYDVDTQSFKVVEQKYCTSRCINCKTDCRTYCSCDPRSPLCRVCFGAHSLL